MSHADAALTPRARLRLDRLIVEHGWPVSRATDMLTDRCPTPLRALATAWPEYLRPPGRPNWAH